MINLDKEDSEAMLHVLKKAIDLATSHESEMPYIDDDSYEGGIKPILLAINIALEQGKIIGSQFATWEKDMIRTDGKLITNSELSKYLPNISPQNYQILKDHICHPELYDGVEGFIEVEGDLLLKIIGGDFIKVSHKQGHINLN